MANQIHLWPEDPTTRDGDITLSVVIEGLADNPKRLWYRLPAEHREAVTHRADPFVLGLLFSAMQAATGLVVHGDVTASLLQNLEEFQAAWHCWRPERYTAINISADREISHRPNPASGAVAAFSGGVDSCFTVWRHHTGRSGRQTQPLQAGVMIHGFDIPLDQTDVFERALAKSAAMLNSLGLPLIPLATNFRSFRNNWEDVFAAATAACLNVLQQKYNVGLFGSSEPYQALVLPWGSNPITDGLLASDAFQFIHDGAAFGRLEKVREIADWPEAQQYLRVCWQGDQKDRNCGQCEKCIRTILNFRVVGLQVPACFEQDVSDKQIAGLRQLSPVLIAEYSQMLKAAEAASMSEPWVGALKRSIFFSRLRLQAQQITALRQLYRHTVGRIKDS